MSDFGEILDMFSNDGEENKKSRGQTGQQEETENDPKSAIIGKLKRNKPLLIATVVVGLSILGAIIFFLSKYVVTNGIKSIIDIIKSFTN